MRALRILIIAAVVTGSFLLIANPASAQISTQVSVGSPHLVAKGAQLDVPLIVLCDPSLNIALGDANATQVTGHMLAAGFGNFVNFFPGVPCTGSPQVQHVIVPSSTSFAFKPGHATVSAFVFIFDPVASVGNDISVGPVGVRISSK